MLTMLQNLVGWLVALVTGRRKRYYGRARGPVRPDPRDKRWEPSEESLKALPRTVDLRSQDGPIFDQGALGSCTANGWLGLFMFVCRKLFGESFMGSRLMLYYDTRVLEGTPDEDSGCYVRDGAKVLAQTGVCSETSWPYDIGKFTQKPPAPCYVEAQKHKAVDYMRVNQDIKHQKACLAEGFPYVFGFEVFESFESATVSRTGIMPMPKPGERVVGGHCVEAIGYVDGDGKEHYFNNRTYRLGYALLWLFSSLSHGLRVATGLRIFPVTPPANTIICRNSWGTGWGDQGYFYMPYAFISNPEYASDFWTIRKVTHNKAA